MNSIFSPDSFFAPSLSTGTEALIRVSYAVLLLLTLAQAWPHRRRFFCSERWGGYTKSSPGVDRIQNPQLVSVVLFVWFASALMIAAGVWTVWAALVNVLFARYFFVQLRWKSVLRGMGAPGFMTYWLAAVVFLLLLADRLAPGSRSLTILAAQADFAFIMLSAGVYKFTAGYAHNHGMEYGLVNPEWGYWWQDYRRISPDHWLFILFNHLGWGTEVVAGALMFIPATRLLGGMLILVSFVFIATQIRLGFLCEMVMTAALLFTFEGGQVARLIDQVADPVSHVTASATWPPASTIMTAALWAYLVLLPLAHAGLFYNFYSRRRLPGLLQPLLERYTAMFGLIIWRVFSVDVVNFYIVIHREQNGTGRRVLVSRYGWRGGLRYSHVAESITVTSLFTTLKYYPSNGAMFRDRLLRYARTVPCGGDEKLVFEYVVIEKHSSVFASRPVAEYVVDPRSGSVEELVIDPSVSIRTPHAASPVHEGIRPGTYAPLSA
jgi:hypothetical protein